MTELIFLLASERSGSNLISRIFGAHRDICAPGPSHLFRIMGCNRSGYRDDMDGRRTFEADLRALFAAKISRWKLDETDPHLGFLDADAGQAKAILSIYQAEAAAAGKSGLFIKENQLYQFLDFVLGLGVEPKFLYLVRDPRDMALSWQNARIARGGVIRAADVWVEDQTQFLSALDRLHGRFRTTSITYENLIHATESCLRGACKDLGLSFDPHMLKFYKTDDAQANAAASADWRNLARSVLDANSGKFRDAFSVEQIAYIEHVCRAPMATLGYEVETDGLRPFGKFETFADLREDLSSNEPWEKAAYVSVPEDEKQKRKIWADVQMRIEARAHAAAAL